MLSRISIDLDNDNQPIIKIDFLPSDDVRDKMVKRFMETFGGNSWFATFHYNNNSSDMTVNSCAIIRPLPVSQFQYQLPDFIYLNDEYLKNTQKISNLPHEAKEK